jgi:hypothetical protein
MGYNRDSVMIGRSVECKMSLISKRAFGNGLTVGVRIYLQVKFVVSSVTREVDYILPEMHVG